MFLPFIYDKRFFEAPDGNGGTPPDGDTSFFKAGETPPPEGNQPPPDGTPPPPDGTPPPPDGDRPDWLLKKFESPEDQAKAYSDMYRSFSKKTDDLRAEVMQDAIKEYGKSIGVPEDHGDYGYPEGFTKPTEGVDASLREWAQKNNVSKDGFESLISDVWKQTQVDHAKEFEALGEGAQERIEEVNRYVSANVDKDLFATVGKVMQTAEGVKLIEALMGHDSGYAPGDTPAPDPELTRENIRALQADPKFGADASYTKMVRDKWAAFAKLPGQKQQ